MEVNQLIIWGKKEVMDLVFIIFIVTLLILLASGIQIAVALGITAICLLLIFQGMPLQVIAQTAFSSVNSYAMAAIPFFILAGDLIMNGGLATRFLNLAGIFLRRFHGGLAVAVMMASIFFAAVSGSSVASAAALGRNVVEMLDGEAYPRRFSAAIVAVGSTLGLMIPPSLSFIIIGSMQGLPIVTLFTAGIVPGLIQGFVLAVASWYICRRNNWGHVTNKPIDVNELKTNFKGSLGVLFMPVLILGGIYLGFFTPTEVSAVAAIYAFIVAVIVYKTLPVKNIFPTIKRSLLQSGMIYFIVIGGNLAGFMLTSLGITNSIVQLITELGIQAWQFLLMVNIILLILGMVLDGISVLILSVPILFPLAMSLGVNPIHLAVIMTANVEIATLTPPVGLNLFVMSGVSKLPIDEVARGVGPFYIIRFAMLLLITYVPQISLLLV